MEKKWFIGIDISKSTFDVVIYDSTKKKADDVNYKNLPNNKDGYKVLFSWFKEKKMQCSDLVVCLESTGIYSFDICLYFEQKGVDYSALNPLHLKRSMGLVRGKNDKIDADRIAYYCYLHRDELVYSKLSGSTILRLQALCAERKRFVKQLSAHKGYLTDRKNRTPDSTSERSKLMVDILEKQILLIEKEMMALVESDEAIYKNYTLLVSIKGIAHVNAISTIIHTNNFEAFENARQYACYLGIAPFEHQSGTSVRGKTRVCRTGAKQLKADLSQAAKSAAQWDAEMKIYYQRKIEAGKEYGVVMNAIKFKLIGRMFAVVKRGTPFVPLMQYSN